MSGNSAPVGGGITAGFSSVNLSNSTVSGNLASQGGGINTSGSSVTLDNCTVSGNSAASNGGGILAGGSSSVTLDNSTVSDNSAYIGGGIKTSGSSSSVTLSNSTMSGNSASFGGGIYANLSSVNLSNSIVAGNNGSSGAEIQTSTATFTTSNNLLGDSSHTYAEAFENFVPDALDITATSGSVQATALSSILAPLADNGGATQTHELVAGSPAISAADTSVCPKEDQRGEPRELDGLFFPVVTANNKAAIINLDGECDIGSFEK